MPDRDLLLLETVRTHRERLSAAFLFGPLDERRPAADPVRRLSHGLVPAALGCAGCVGYGLVLSLLSTGRLG